MDALPFRGPAPVSRLAADLRSQGYRGAIVGPEGSGKSTLLREIAEQLSREDRRVRVVRFDDAASLARALVDRRTIWLVDGAERIPLPIRWLMTMAIGRIVITTHRSSAGLPVLLRTRTTVSLLNALLSELGAVELSTERVETVFRRSGGDLRVAFRSLYDDAAQDLVGAFRAR